MAGKAYTMREMRAMVEYLSERKAYGEIRGRKMWTEFANSDKTTRTWQSLKETFLKRILPDIHNPYYRLTMDQIRSFQQGVDVAEKEKNNRLEFRTTHDDLNGENQNGPSTITKDDEVPTTSHQREEPSNINNEPPITSIDDEMEKVTGEDIKAAKIPSRSRSSTETLVLEYENAEEVQRVLESPNTITDAKSKSLKDKLTFEYSAPLTPLVRDLLDDFATDSEASDAEPRLNIDENSPKTNNTESEVVEEAVSDIKIENVLENNMINNEADCVIEIYDTENSDNTEISSKNVETSEANETSNTDPIHAKSDKALNSEIDNSKLTSNNDTGTLKSIDQNSQQDDSVTIVKSNLEGAAVLETAVSNDKEIEKSNNTVKNDTDCICIIPNTENSTQNTTFDSLLPNNPEALNDTNKNIQKEILDKSKKISDKAKTNENRLRKRSSSRDSRDSKKQKMTDVKSKDRKVSVDEILDPPSPSILKEKSVDALEKKSTISNTPVVEVSTDTTTINNTGEQIGALSKQTLENLSESSVATEKDILNTSVNQNKKSTEIEDKNLCLLSVSLFEEQFKNAKYSDSDSDKATKQKQNADKPQVVTEKPNETKNIPQKAMNKKETELGMEKKIPVITVDSDREVNISLESSVDCELPNQRVVNNNKKANLKVQREKALANVFGFAHGHVAPSTRKRHLSHRRRSHHHQRRYSKQIDSNSSEWTSESDSESYVSPPRSRRNKHTKRYLKPKSSRILQDPEEEILYVLFGKNIYPLVKDGKHIKKFLNYTPDSGTDEGESFWKQKYIEERKRVADFRKLLKETQKDTQETNKSTVPMTSQNSSRHSVQNTTENVNSKQISEVEPKAEPRDDKIVLKIAGRNGLEYCLEGGWNQISNAMPQVVQMLRCEMATDDRKPVPINGTNDQTKADIQMAVGSGDTTPVPATVDEEVHEKVNKIESEIFNEIKNLEVQQMKEEVKHIETDSSNVTKRKPNKSKESLPRTPKGPVKRARSSKTNSTDSKLDEPKTKRISKLNTNANLEEIDKPTKTKTTDQTSDAEQEELTPPIETKVVEKLKKTLVKKSSARLSKQREINEQNDNLGENALVGTKTSTRSLRTPKKLDTHSSENDVKPQVAPNKESKLRSFDENARYMFPPEKNIKKPTGNKKSLPEINIMPPQELGNSVDNAYGYEDSDPSPMKLYLSKRKRKISFTARNKSKNKRLRRKSCPLLEQPSSDSNNSAYFIPLRRSLSSLNSEIYRSNSFQLLMPKQNRSSKNLERIDENSPALVKSDSDIRHFSSVSKVSNKSSENSGLVLEMGSSSNVSLPFSPELSIVENISICREVIKDAEPPTINEAQQNMNDIPMDYSEYMISNIDVSVPLMDQRCNLRKSIGGVTSVQNDSVQLKDCTVNLTMSDTLDQRLRELLLESTKKPTEDKNKQTPMEVDQTSVTIKKSKVRKRKENMAMDVDESKAAIKKTRANKRSSTPQKKKTVLKGKAPPNTIIEEEHVESCSAGRKSCPPVMTFIPIDENANNSSDISLAIKVGAKKKKTKDIIKVKIHKPVGKNRSKENVRGKSVGDGSLASTYTDSGINDTETISLMLKDCSVDLIHNHSETCLLANECIGSNSVEFVQNSSISIISLTSSRSSPEARTSDKIYESPETVYHSPCGSINSLITEDLSNSPPTKPTKWYLFEEDVTNPESVSNVASCGSNLNQIFPITCAVPNLSTISEMSKENEDSRNNSI